MAQPPPSACKEMTLVHILSHSLPTMLLKIIAAILFSLSYKYISGFLKMSYSCSHQIPSQVIGFDSSCSVSHCMLISKPQSHVRHDTVLCIQLQWLHVYYSLLEVNSSGICYGWVLGTIPTAFIQDLQGTSYHNPPTPYLCVFHVGPADLLVFTYDSRTDTETWIDFFVCWQSCTHLLLFSGFLVMHNTIIRIEKMAHSLSSWLICMQWEIWDISQMFPIENQVLKY